MRRLDFLPLDFRHSQQGCARIQIQHFIGFSIRQEQCGWNFSQAVPRFIGRDAILLFALVESTTENLLGRGKVVEPFFMQRGDGPWRLVGHAPPRAPRMNVRGGRPVRCLAVSGCNPYPPPIEAYPHASIETTLRSGLIPNLGAAARIASAM